MLLPKDPLSLLKEALTNKRTVIVVGTGVSVAATINPVTGKPHPQATWAGLLRCGLYWLIEHNFDAKRAAALQTMLEEDPQTEDFISAAQNITRRLAGDNLKEWLEATVGSIKATNRDILDALEALRSHGNLLATTNYDDLLTNKNCHPYTWKDDGAFPGGCPQPSHRCHPAPSRALALTGFDHPSASFR